MLHKLKTELATEPTQLAPVKVQRLHRWAQRAAIVGIGFAVASALRPTTAVSADAARGLTEVLAADGRIAASPSDVHWIDRPPPWWAPWTRSRAWVLGAQPNELDDVYLVFARRTPEGAVLDLKASFNISDTRAAAEQQLAANGHRAAWVSGNNEELLRFQQVDLSRSPLALPEARELTALQQWQLRITWLQETGHARGISYRAFKLVPPVSSAHLQFVDDTLHLTTPAGQTTFTRYGRPASGGEFVAEQQSGLAQPGNLITWSVDRVRQLPWFGDENMQRLKAVAYKTWDWLQRALGSGSDEGTPVLVATSASQSDAGERRSSSRVDSSAHNPVARPWPPASLQPILADPQPGEGEWLSLADDPFIKPSPDPLGLFYTTFLRTDPEREFSRILITAWDSLTVDLHMMSGTEEPKSATGETGTGLVPRAPEIAENLVAAFNGGFQATHGDFGMMVEGTLYVPPLPFAATVARDINGRIGFGTWPDDTTIPDYLRSFRQNLTPLVADGEYNPYGRSWWGGVPSGWEDDTRTVRSGLCLTTAGLVAYFYGAKVDAEHLAKAMLAMECSYGLHLDMNQGHTGLEFYHVAREEQLPPLALTLDSMWQAEGAVSHADGLRYRGRRMFRSMQLMNFPRFIGRESRDFFYLTARRLVRSGAKRENDGRAWTIPAVARSVFPYPLSTSHQKPDPERPGTRVNLVELDPKLLSPAPGDTSDTRPIVNLPIPSPTLKGLKLWWQDGKAYVDGQPGAPGALLVANGHARSDHAKAAFCVHPGSGHLWYAEVATGFEPLRDGLLLGNVLKEQGCLGPILYWSSASEFLVGARDLSGHPTQPSGAKLGLAYRAHRRTFRLFPDTPVVKQSVWKPLQNNR